MPGRKARALLTYLAFARSRPQPRDRLASMLWPDASLRNARLSLRQTVFELRRALEQDKDHTLPFTATADTLRLDTEGLEIDVYETVLRLRTAEDARTVMQELDGFGPLFPDLLDISQPFDDWMAALRQSLMTEVQDALKLALDMHRNRPQDVRQIASAALDLDPSDEFAVRCLMRAHADMNEVPNALRVYTKFYEYIENELDAEPSMETQDLAVELKLATDPAPDFSGTRILLDRPRDSLPRVAVLPFEQFGPDTLPDYVPLALLDEITCNLAGLQSIGIISSNSTRGYLGGAATLERVSSDLGAEYVVFGSLRSRNGQSAINVQVVEAQNAQIIHAKTYECGTEDILNIRFPVASNIAHAVVPYLDKAELQKTRHLAQHDLAPHHLVLRAKEKVFELTEVSFAKAGLYLEQAIEKSPYFAPAFGLKAEWHSIRVWQRWSPDPRKDSQAFEACARRSLFLDPNQGRIIAMLGHNAVLARQEHDMALSLFDKAIELLPNDSETLSWTVPSLAFCSRNEEAVSNGRRAIALSPQDPFLFRNQHFLSIALYASGQYDEAAELGLRCYDTCPNYVSNIRMTAAALQAAGRGPEADPLAASHRALAPDFDATNFGDGPPFLDTRKKRQLLLDLKAVGLPA